MTDDLRRLLDERAIQQQLVRFARAMDERDWQAISDLSFDDATADVGTGPLTGSAALIDCIRSFLDVCGPTQHLLGNVLIEVDGDRATSRAYVSDVHLGAGDWQHLTFSTLGDYHDTWERDGDRWRLRHRTKLNRGHVGTFEVFGMSDESSSAPTGGRETAICNLLYRYAELMDAGDFAGAAELFRHAEIVLDVERDVRVDSDALLKIWTDSVIRYADGTPRTKHVTTNPLVTVDEAEGTATCRSYYTVLQQTDTLPLQPIVAGRYHDTFECVDGAWRFSERVYALVDLIGDTSHHLRGRL